MLALDHVIIAVGDLDAAADRLLEQHGLGSVPGGVHAGFGTANRIVPLGDSYIELMGVVDTEVAAKNFLGEYLLGFLADGDRLFAWCVRTDDISWDAKRIGSGAVPMSRRKPDGSELSWRLTGLEGALADRSLPFFIQWDGHADAHPGRDPAEHRVDARGISSLDVAGNKTKISNRLGRADLPVNVVRGDPGPVSVTIATSNGEIVLT